MAAAIKRIGIFGGTFNPVHFGHLYVAEAVRSHAGLDRIIFIPTGNHPFKQQQDIAPAADRLAMLNLAIADNPFFEISDIEIRRDGNSYTVETLEYFHQAGSRNQQELFFLMGADNLGDFSRWKSPERIAQLCRILAFGREGSSLGDIPDALKDRFERIELPLFNISATTIRRRIRAGHSVRYMLPLAVQQYIVENQLYFPLSGEVLS